MSLRHLILLEPVQRNTSYKQTDTKGIRTDIQGTPVFGTGRIEGYIVIPKCIKERTSSVSYL